VRRASVLFVNPGILGHHAVAGLLQDAAGRMPGIESAHLDLTSGLTIRERLVRRVLCARIAPAEGWAANVDLARWRRQWNAGLLAARRIAAAERRRRFDVVHFHTQSTAWASLGRMQRGPAIVSIDATERQASEDMASPLARASYRANISRDRRVFDAAAAITATSRWAAGGLAAIYPECAAKVHVMPYPVRVEGFDASWADARAERVRQLPAAPVRVLFIGGDFPRKGGPLLLDAWRAAGLAERAQLDLVSDWPIAADAVPQGVRAVRGVEPYTPRWFELWRDADLFVMPTSREAFGMVFQEAAVAALPAIGTRINAIPELVEDGTTGVLVRPDNCRDLVAALRALIDSPELRLGLGRAARHRMLTLASPDRYAAALHTLIDRVAERSRTLQTNRAGRTDSRPR
jgi:glycosyltransferase involved in cell wall biosynthesis